MKDMMQKPTQPQAPEQPKGGQGPSPQDMEAGLEMQPQYQQVILGRIMRESNYNPNFGQAIDEGMSPAAAMEIALILPELHFLFEAMGLFKNLKGMDQGPIKGGAGPSQQQNLPQQAPVKAKSDNPIVNDDLEQKGVSRGLMGV